MTTNTHTADKHSLATQTTPELRASGTRLQSNIAVGLLLLTAFLLVWATFSLSV
jgi:hypothetical protein